MPTYTESRRIYNLEYVIVLFTKFRKELFDANTEKAIELGLAEVATQLHAEIVSVDYGPNWIKIQFKLPPEKAPNSFYGQAGRAIGNKYRVLYPDRAPKKTAPFFTGSHILRSVGADTVSSEEIEAFLATLHSSQNPFEGEFRP